LLCRHICDNERMTETPEQRVARLQHEVDQAKIDDLNRQLAAAQAAAGHPVTPGQVFTVNPGQPIMMHRFPPPVDGPPLAPAPRKVPWHFKAVVLPWSWWTVFALFMIAVAPVIVWIGVPLAGAVVGAGTFLVIVFLRIRRDRLQLSLLKWGELANVVNAETVGVGTYYSGVTYQNVRMAQAHGWHVERQWYSGPGTSTKITYEIRGNQGTIGLHGLPYDGGVILADPRKPDHALCISSYAYDLDRDPSGNWIGNLPTRVVIGSIAMTVALLAWTATMVGVCTVMALDVDGLVRPFNQ
jgi:hypothetical protein